MIHFEFTVIINWFKYVQCDWTGRMGSEFNNQLCHTHNGSIDKNWLSINLNVFKIRSKAAKKVSSNTESVRIQNVKQTRCCHYSRQSKILMKKNAQIKMAENKTMPNVNQFTVISFKQIRWTSHQKSDIQRVNSFA